MHLRISEIWYYHHSYALVKKTEAKVTQLLNGTTKIKPHGGLILGPELFFIRVHIRASLIRKYCQLYSFECFWLSLFSYHPISIHSFFL